MEETVNHYHNENQQDIYEDLQFGFPETDEGDFNCGQMFESEQDIESMLNMCEHSGKYSQDEYILFIKTVREEGI